MFLILILGAYGTFGVRICHALSSNPTNQTKSTNQTESTIQLAIAGRDREGATAFAASLGATCEPIVIDHQAPDFAATLSSLRPNLVIHTAGPFQAQDYRVASAAIDAGAHYIDLADARAFVARIGALDERARARGVLVTSGASTLPAVSSAVVERLAAGRSGLDELHRIEISIAPAQAIARGLATLESVLSYCGKPFLERAWRVSRASACCAWRAGSIASAPTSAACTSRSRASRRPGSRCAARGTSSPGRDTDRRYLCIPAIVLARKLASGEPILAGAWPGHPLAPGARPCVEMMPLEEFDAEAAGFDIRWEVGEEATTFG